MNAVHLQELDRNKPIDFGIQSNLLDIDSLNESDMIFQANMVDKIDKYNSELDEESYNEIDPEEELNFNH